MGKKSKATTKPAPAPIVQPPTPAVTTSTSSSASANSFQNLFRNLVSTPEGASEERSEILQKLSIEYKSLVSNNRLNAQKERYLSEELQKTQGKFDEVNTEASKVKAEYDALNAKHLKLRALSRQLSDRTKQSDANAAAKMYEEQQLRVKLTESFSASIAGISAKLDSLTARREAVVTENMRLKALLRSCLEEFDADQKLQERETATAVAVEGEGGEKPAVAVAVAAGDTAASEQVYDEDTGEQRVVESLRELGVEEQQVDNASQAEETVNVDVAVSGEPPLVPATAAGTSESAEQVTDTAAAEETIEKEQAEAGKMEFEEDLGRLEALRQTEQQLREKSAQYASAFDAFQSQLSSCNANFQSKQASIEALSKEMAQLEKENATVSKRVSDCVLSTKVMMTGHGNILGEQKKQLRALERYSGLMEVLQREIASAGTAGSSK